VAGPARGRVLVAGGRVRAHGRGAGHNPGRRGPIDNQIDDWTAATLPGDWRSIQSRWELWHTMRTFASIAAVVAVTISAVVPARPDQPPIEEVSPQGRTVAGRRSA
jgi:hypothetical protein